MKVITTITKTYDETKLEEIMQEASCVYHAAELIAFGVENVMITDLRSALETLKNRLLDGKCVSVYQFVYECGFGLEGVKVDTWKLEIIEEVTTITME